MRNFLHSKLAWELASLAAWIISLRLSVCCLMMTQTHRRRRRRCLNLMQISSRLHSTRIKETAALTVVFNQMQQQRSIECGLVESSSRISNQKLPRRGGEFHIICIRRRFTQIQGEMKILLKERRSNCVGPSASHLKMRDSFWLENRFFFVPAAAHFLLPPSAVRNDPSSWAPGHVTLSRPVVCDGTITKEKRVERESYIILCHPLSRRKNERGEGKRKRKIRKPFVCPFLVAFTTVLRRLLLGN